MKTETMTFIIPRNTVFPNKIILKQLNQGTNSETYFEKKSYYAVRHCEPIIEINSDDSSIGRCVCSNCGDTRMDPHDNFCRKCGALNMRKGYGNNVDIITLDELDTDDNPEKQ